MTTLDRRALPGVQWIPPNGSSGAAFFETYCTKCARDKAMREGAPFEECDDDEVCEIIARSFSGEAVEWREVPGKGVTCVAFVEADKTIPHRCAHTMDMFPEAP